MGEDEANEAVSEVVEGDGDGVVVGAVYGALESVGVVSGDLVGVGGIGDLFPVEVVVRRYASQRRNCSGW